MALGPGTRLGAYEIIRLLGSGGMGEVYRAKDTTLGREVALKFLPATFTNDPERVARFRREAQVLASLNHPHIAQIHGLDEANGTQFLILELVDGESLDKRIAGGRIPVDEALGIARQIAGGLEAAHEKGIIHRDLKPANIALTKDGQVKLLDFGLAKAVEPAATSSLDVTNSPTITTPAMMTGVGVILGTASYMSPEQAKGRPADKRSDIWAFGCVLYEMVTAKRAFAGDDVSDTLAAVLRGEPDWSARPNEVPANVRLLLQRALAKDRAQRIADVSTAAFLIDEPSLQPHPVTADSESRMRRGTRNDARVFATVSAAIAVGCMVALLWMWRVNTSTPSAITRFSIALADTQSFGSNGLRLIAVSPDGMHIAYAALAMSDPASRPAQTLYLRTLADDEVGSSASWTKRHRQRRSCIKSMWSSTGKKS